jgi:hypothetical protein
MSLRSNAPAAILELAERIKLRHGDVRIAREKSGWHIYCASPIGLVENGRIELTKKHLAINAEKLLGIGKFAAKRGSYSQDRTAQCMKTGKCYLISDLLQMPPLAARGIQTKGTARVSVSDTSKSLVRDAAGNLVPDVPGVTVPLSSLPADHPAIQYLTRRGYSIPALEFQFGAAFCTQEAPESEELNRWYRRGPDGFYDTPQNRIIFYVDVKGVRRGWQARYIEAEAEKVQYILHPYRNQWVATAQRDQKGKWAPLPGYDTLNLSKYKTAFGASRNEIVMGYDAAVQWNKANALPRPVCVISEGPLDAARIGAPGLAVMGKSLSENQARLVADYFRRVILVADNDKPGQEAKAKMFAELSEYLTDITCVDVPSQYKDLGEMPYGEAMALLGPHLWKR